MLDHNDKEWVEDLIDRKLEETKSDLRSEMQEMSADIITKVTAVFENTKASQQITKNESPNWKQQWYKKVKRRVPQKYSIKNDRWV